MRPITKLYLIWFRIKLLVFRWVTDDEWDVGLQLFRCVTFIKYKDCTLIYWFRHFERAENWQRYAEKAN